LVPFPTEFSLRMRSLLGEEDYGRYLSEMEAPPFRGIRLNPLKCSAPVLSGALPFSLKPAPFSPFSFYIPAQAEKIGSLPMHHAGAFYAQEPSAASAVTVLDPQPGEKILDLCAAPGGKSTQIAALLEGKGLLWSNEIVRSRAGILLSNLERIGARNAVISCCHPEKLCTALAGFFDRVLVDAPCSGEGLFRREEQAVSDWSEKHVKACAVRQLAILESAASAVREDGLLVYSTCTFSREENERVVSMFLERHPDFEPSEFEVSFGRPGALRCTRRIFPMDGGEGHFVAAMRRRSGNLCRVQPYRLSQKPDRAAAELFRSVFQSGCFGSIEPVRENFTILPAEIPELSGLEILRAGVLLGTRRGERIEPAHALFMAARPEELRNVVSLRHDSAEIYAFLRGEEIEALQGSGYAGVSVDGVLTGFGKISHGRLKNHYPKGLRNKGRTGDFPRFLGPTA
jgi:NOL1/NOP2/sun family putative RNA methylase